MTYDEPSCPGCGRHMEPDDWCLHRHAICLWCCQDGEHDWSAA